MSRHTANRRPSFFWQGLMVLLPVALLVAASAWAIWKDYRSVEDDAVQEAQVLADRWAADLARHLGDTIVKSAASFVDRPRSGSTFSGAVALDKAGLFKPGVLPAVHFWESHGPESVSFGPVVLSERGLLPDVRLPVDVPVPPAWRTELSGESLRCWDRALGELDSSPNVLRLWDEFLATDPPVPARANAGLRRLLLEKPDVDLLLDALRRDGRIPTESGLPLAAVGLVRLIERLNRDDSRLTAQSALWAETIAPALFDQILGNRREAFPGLRDGVEWERRHRALILALTDRIGGRGPVKSSAWIGAEGQRVFAWAEENSRMGIAGPPLPDAVFFVRAEVLKAELATWLGNNAPRNGEPFGLGVTLEGEPLGPVLVGAAQERNPRVLASATAPLPNASQLKSSFSVKTPFPTANSVPTNSAVFPVETSFPVPPPAIRPASLGVMVFLADPAVLFARARSRAWLMGSITLGAALVAILGFLLARRAFHRQLALNEQKSNFVSAVSHELRAPIAAVRLMTENLTRGAPAEQERQREYFGLILQECRRLSSLIENVLDFSRIEQGRKEYEMEPTDLATLASATVQLMEPVATDHGVRLRVETGCRGEEAEAARTDDEVLVSATSAATVDCDGRAIQQALVNLIDNAIKHSPSGAEVVVALGSRPKSVLLTVTDHGPGIPSEEHGRVFDLFYRRGSELRRETQGVGIGLNIVRHIVRAHGGNVWIEDAPGGGCRAVIELRGTLGGREERES